MESNLEELHARLDVLNSKLSAADALSGQTLVEEIDQVRFAIGKELDDETRSFGGT
jgi:hypothetical protein